MSIIKKAQPLFSTPWMQCRHTGKINFKKPKSHYDRHLMYAITAPVYPKTPELPLRDRCGYLQFQDVDQQVNPYEKFQRKECRTMFVEYTMLMFAHHLPTKGRLQREINVKLHKSNLFIRKFDLSTLRHVIEDSEFSNIAPLLSEHVTCIVSNDCNPKQLLATTKKIPNLVILGGIYEDRIMSVSCLTKAANLGDLDVVRGELCSILQSSARSTNSILSSQQQSLSSNLSQYIKDQNNKEN